MVPLSECSVCVSIYIYIHVYMYIREVELQSVPNCKSTTPRARRCDQFLGIDLAI
jgi:hypothetical protein